MPSLLCLCDLLQKQQAAYQEERRRREREWELKERGLGEWEERLREEEEETKRKHQELVEERESLQRKKEEFQREVDRLREAQRKLERDKELLRRDTEQLEATRKHEVSFSPHCCSLMSKQVVSGPQYVHVSCNLCCHESTSGVMSPGLWSLCSCTVQCVCKEKYSDRGRAVEVTTASGSCVTAVRPLLRLLK